MGPIRSEDIDLMPENFGQLNRQFYVANPTDYFNLRVEHLMLRAGRSDDMDALATAGVEYRGLKAGHAEMAEGDKDSEESRTKRAKEVQRFVLAEAEVLSHHVGETLLRLYLAHQFRDGESPPTCPWLEVSRLRDFSRAKELVAARFGRPSDLNDPANLREVARVFQFVDDPKLLPEAAFTTEQWGRSLQTIESYLRGFAGQFLDHSGLYNAAKHGLAVLPGEGSMQLGDGEMIRADGPMVQYLHVTPREGRPRWSVVHHWVQPDLQMALVVKACQLINMLWEVAKFRYLPEQREETMTLALLKGPTWLELKQAAAPDKGFVLETMSIGLSYYLPADEVAAATPPVGDAESEPNVDPDDHTDGFGGSDSE